MDKNYQNSFERAERTKSFLKAKGVPVLETLPLIESEKEAKIRNAKDVARRAIILYEIAGVGFDVDTKETIETIKKVKLWKRSFSAYLTSNCHLIATSSPAFL